ncbi:MAG TPA: hypothetical protein VHG91_01345, partial [Longimicrobium sp.]|nr:hypothetical protein [Longimicrobium sp.]
MSDPEVTAFVEGHDVPGLSHAAPVVEVPAHDLVLFRVAYTEPRTFEGLYREAFGLKYRGRIGWLDPSEGTREDVL